MLSITRRSVAGGLLAASSAAALGAPAREVGAQEAGGLRVRRSLARMRRDDPDLQALAYAVSVMRTNTGPLSWVTQRRVHAAPWGHHNSWRFLPWHRLQLYYLERIIAQVSGKSDFAMPYWDWSTDHAPASFFQPTSPLYDETRTITASTRISGYLGFEWSQAGRAGGDFWARTENDFGDFFGSQNPTGMTGSGYAGSGEQYGHNLCHVFVGGRMRNLLESPLDPLFWAHHSNVDRQWAIWSQIHGGDQTYPPEFKAEACTGYVDADGYLSPVRRAGEALDTWALGYAYDDVSLARQVLEPERWAGQADPSAPPVLQQTLPIQRASPAVARVFCPPELLTNLPGAQAPILDVKAFLQILGMDGYVVRLTSRSADGGSVFGRDALFSVPMGGMGMGMNPMGHRAQLRALVPRDPRALAQGFWIEAEADLLRGERSGMPPEVTDFVVDFRAQV